MLQAQPRSRCLPSPGCSQESHVTGDPGSSPRCAVTRGPVQLHRHRPGYSFVVLTRLPSVPALPPPVMLQLWPGPLQPAPSYAHCPVLDSLQ